MEYSTIIFDLQEGIATVTLNRPERMNALSPDLGNEMLDAIQRVQDDPDARVMVITGSGRAFCAGADLKQVGARDRQPTPAELRANLRGGFQKMMLALRDLDKPAIASVNGHAVGGGLDLAAACDLRIASDEARFGEAFVKVGLFPATGGAWLLPRLIGPARALEMIWTGNTISAAEAERIGLINKVVPAAELAKATREMALSLAQGPTIALGLAKSAVYKGLQVDFAAGLEYAATAETITLGSEDHKEGLRAFIEKRLPVFKGR